ncbi:MAG: ABC transporter ATP-binding protein [Planctomycetota bacterium]
MPSPVEALVVEEVVKRYPTPGEPLEVLSGVSVTVDRGESLAILGPSGCGKSTLLAIVGALDRPTEGRVAIAGEAPFELADDALSAFRGRHIGFVFQDHYLLPQCTVLENVLVPLLAIGPTGAEQHERARQLIDRVGLSDRLTHRPAELSGGERQRVAIARALIRDPLLVLADEPTGNLDAPTAESVTRLLLELQAERSSVLVVVTHSGHLAEQLDRRTRLEAGRLVEA